MHVHIEQGLQTLFRAAVSQSPTDCVSTNEGSTLLHRVACTEHRFRTEHACTEQGLPTKLTELSVRVHTSRA